VGNERISYEAPAIARREAVRVLMGRSPSDADPAPDGDV
jgi:hypothetical protein